MRALCAALIIGSLAVPAAGEPRFILPVDCTLGQDCYIQQYLDHDPSEAATDYLCQSLSYDGHKGTDFALPHRAAMESGVDVLAAATGTVLGVRDGMPDAGPDGYDAKLIQGKDCGNGLVLDHGDGWQSQYCHLKADTLTATKGTRIEAGTRLGQIGMSGRTEFPHLHLSIRKDGAQIDPFAPDGASCDELPERTLWQNAPIYQAGGILHMGFAPRVPDYSAVKAGTAAERIMRTSPAIVGYVFAFGARPGDMMRTTITGPGDFSVTDSYDVPRNRAQFFRAAGKKRRSAPWPGGTYSATSQLIRDGKIISEQQTTATIPR